VNRGEGPKANSKTTRAWEQRSQDRARERAKTTKRKPIKPMSDKRRDDAQRRRLIREAVFERDGGCVMAGWRGPCFGPPTPHHLRKASQGGKYTRRNLVTACSFHNGLVETHPDEARERGWVK
jgi:hypothetical protein